MTVTVGHDQTISVAIQSDANVTAVFKDLLGQIFRVSSPNTIVNVEPIGLIPHSKNIGPQLVIHGWCHMIGRTIGAIDQNSQPFKIHRTVNR